MAIKITNTEFSPLSLITTEKRDFLFGHVAKDMNLVLEFTVATKIIASTDDPLMFAPSDGYDSLDHIVHSLPSFADFYLGDTIRVSGTVDNNDDYTIIEKISNYDIRVLKDSGTMTQELVADTATIFVTTPITGAKLSYNLIENSEPVSYLSKVDGSYQQAQRGNLNAGSATVMAMYFLNSKCYQVSYGSMNIEGVDLIDTSTDYESKFKITHNFYITPLFTQDQYLDLTNEVAPSYFLNEKCLKYIYKLEALKDITDPNIVQTIEGNAVLGNTGWYGEHYNAVPTNYYITAPIYKDSSGTVIEKLAITTAQQFVEINLYNTVNSPFSTGHKSACVVGFYRTPDDEADYIGNDRYMDENFMLDHCDADAISAGSGIKFGTVRQTIKAVNVTFINSSHITVLVNFQFGSEIISEYLAANRRSYVIFIEAAKADDSGGSNDRIRLLVDANTLFVDESDPTLIDQNVTFLRHYEDEESAGIDEVNAYPEDEIVSQSQVTIDRTNSLTSSVLIDNIKCAVIAKNTVTGETFDLDSYTQSFSGTPIINGQQFIALEIPRPFNIPDTEVRKSIKFTSRQDLQTGNQYFIDVYFPFIFRWEYWTILSSAPAEFYNSSQDLNGFNQFWHHFQTGDWIIEYKQTVTVNKNGTLLTYETESLIQSNDWDSNEDWPGVIKTYDPDTLTELYDAGTSSKFLLGYKPTLVVAEFEHDTDINLDEQTIVIKIEVFEEGGVTGSQRLSSHWEMEPGTTWLKSITSSNKVLKALNTSTKIQGRCLVDYSLLPPKSKFKISSRIYKHEEGAEGVKLMEDGTIKTTEDNFNKLIE